MIKALYLSHDGLLDPLGQSQILPCLARLSGPEIRITLMTFEKPRSLADRAAVERAQATCAKAGIRWTRLRYHRYPPLVSTAWDMVRGLWRAWRIIRREQIEVVHARSYVPACLGVLLKRGLGVKFLFDMRELWVDGRVDGGAWRRGGALHRLGKRFEAWCLAQADAIVSLTDAGKRVVEGFEAWQRARSPIHVIPTCVDVEQFANHRASSDEPPDFLAGRRVIVYLGSVGSWYRFDAMADCFRIVASRWRDALFLVLTPQQELARRLCISRGLLQDQYAIRSVSYSEVPGYLRWAQVSLYFITPAFSKKSSCPTKLGESLAAGLPVLTNAGIGDTDELLRRHRVGVLVDAFEESAYEAGWRQMVELLNEGPTLAARCRQTAREALGLDRGVEAYRKIYRELVGGVTPDKRHVTGQTPEPMECQLAART